MLHKILQKFISQYTIIDSKMGGSVVLFLQPYTAYDDTRLDAYYVEEHKTYLFTKQIVQELCQNGIQASMRVQDFLKPLAQKSGLVGASGNNTLCYHSAYGSRFVIGSLYLQDRVEQLFLQDWIEMPCKNCNLCAKACPTGALDGGFVREKCLRQMQVNGIIEQDDIAKKLGTRIFGCDICQRACPKNSTATMAMPKEIAQILDNVLAVGNAHALKPIIGSNMVKSIVNLSIIYAGNNMQKQHLEHIKELAKQPKYAQNAVRAIRQLEQED